MEDLTDKLDFLLFDNNNGLLTKFHFGQGLDFTLLDSLYEILEEIKKKWETEELIEKKIVFKIIDITPALYMDLELYKNDELYYKYQETLYKLATAIIMVVNPNIDDPFFKKPLKELG